MACSRLNQPSALDVEDQIELARVLIRQEAAALQAGGVQQHVDASAALANFPTTLRHRVRVRQVDAVIVGGAAGCVHRVDGARAACARSKPASSFSTSAGVARSRGP
jgi:hypothetical protein